MLLAKRDSICSRGQVRLGKRLKLFRSHVILVERLDHLGSDASWRVRCTMDLDNMAKIFMLIILLPVQRSIVRAAQNSFE